MWNNKDEKSGATVYRELYYSRRKTGVEVQKTFLQKRKLKVILTQFLSVLKNYYTLETTGWRDLKQLSRSGNLTF